MITIDLPNEIKFDKNIRDYKLFDGVKLVAQWTRGPSTLDNKASHEWFGEWIPATQAELNEYNAKYLKRKFCAKEASASAKAVRSELERALALLKDKFEKGDN